MTLHDYLLALATRYPGTPYATRAQAMSTTLSAATASASGVTVVYSGLRGAERITLTGGGYSWIFGPFLSLSEARARIVAFGDPDLRTAVAERDGQFAVLLGLFRTEDEARSASKPEVSIPFDAAQIAPVTDLVLLDASTTPVPSELGLPAKLGLPTKFGLPATEAPQDATPDAVPDAAPVFDESLPPGYRPPAAPDDTATP